VEGGGGTPLLFEWGASQSERPPGRKRRRRWQLPSSHAAAAL